MFGFACFSITLKLCSRPAGIRKVRRKSCRKLCRKACRKQGMPEALPEGPTEDISGRRPGRPIPSSIISFVIKAPHETMHLALVTI